jgi:malate dehydrogenase (oxaloacetate-decarboxylating)
MDYYKASMEMRRKHKGKLDVTSKPTMIAVVSDGSAVPGLGAIGASAALPVMEVKAALFKEFGGVDAFPICLDTQDADEIVETVKRIAPNFGGVNLENISAPRCFKIERRLKEELDIPVFHDERHGTAVAVSAAVINAFKLTVKPLAEVSAVICGAGAAGVAVAKMLTDLGVSDIVACDSKGVLSKDRFAELGEGKLELLALTNKDNLSGSLAEAVRGRDLFIGVSAPRVLTEEMVRVMAPEPVIFALSNPEPEITPDLAHAVGARIVGTGRPDFPNRIDNVLVFPGVFKGALAARATDITGEMKVAAAYALAGLVADDELSEDYVIPPATRPGVAEAIATAVAEAWRGREV